MSVRQFVSLTDSSAPVVKTNVFYEQFSFLSLSKPLGERLAIEQWAWMECLKMNNKVIAIHEKKLSGELIANLE